MPSNETTQDRPHGVLAAVGPILGKKGEVPVRGIPRQFADGQLAETARIELEHGQAWKDQQDQPRMPENNWTQHAGPGKGEADPSNQGRSRLLEVQSGFRPRRTEEVAGNSHAKIPEPGVRPDVVRHAGSITWDGPQPVEGHHGRASTLACPDRHPREYRTLHIANRCPSLRTRTE